MRKAHTREKGERGRDQRRKHPLKGEGKVLGKKTQVQGKAHAGRREMECSDEKY